MHFPQRNETSRQKFLANFEIEICDDTFVEIGFALVLGTKISHPFERVFPLVLVEIAVKKINQRKFRHWSIGAIVKRAQVDEREQVRRKKTRGGL